MAANDLRQIEFLDAEIGVRGRRWLAAQVLLADWSSVGAKPPP